MKKNFFSSFILLFVLIKCKDDGLCTKSSTTGPEICQNKKVSEGYYKCCYTEYRGQYEDGSTVSYKMCYPATREEYDKIDENMDKSRKEAEERGIKIITYIFDCDYKSNSKYIFASMLYLALLILI